MNNQEKATLKFVRNQKFFSLANFVTKDHPVIKALTNFSLGKANWESLKPFIKSGVILNYASGHNLIAMDGRRNIIANMAGDNTHPVDITHGALGSGSTAFTDNSHTLTAEVYRTVPNSTSYEDDIMYADFFIGAGDVANQTFNEWATFMDGTMSPNSGIAFSLFLTQGWVKTGSMFISSKYQLLNA